MRKLPNSNLLCVVQFHGSTSTKQVDVCLLTACLKSVVSYFHFRVLCARKIKYIIVYEHET